MSVLSHGTTRLVRNYNLFYYAHFLVLYHLKIERIRDVEMYGKWRPDLWPGDWSQYLVVKVIESQNTLTTLKLLEHFNGKCRVGLRINDGHFSFISLSHIHSAECWSVNFNKPPLSPFRSLCIVIWRYTDHACHRLHFSFHWIWQIICWYYVKLTGRDVCGRHMRRSFFRRFRKIAKSDYSLRHVRTSVRMEQLGSDWTDFHEIWYLSIFRTSFGKIQVSLKSDKNNGCFTWRRIFIFERISLSSS